MIERPLHVVLIEDDKQIRRFLYMTLESEGMRVYEAETGKQGLSQVKGHDPDLVILDLGLPDMDGIKVIEQLRTWASMPILILSARSEEPQKVAALDAGADDYLTKPFGTSELLARIRAHLRKKTNRIIDPSESQFRFGDIVVDFALRRVTRGNDEVHLTPIEYRLLLTLIQNAGKVLTHTQLLREVWGPGHAERSHYLRIYMGHLRQKLESDPARPAYIVTETGVGYRFIGS
ncbi:MAG: response regulator [Burkholderiales bacterium]|nr:response regulator [Burkholderiales bacterium]